MLKELNQIKNQRYGYVRVKLLIDYWEHLSQIKSVEVGTIIYKGRQLEYGVLAKGWNHHGTYIQLLYILNSPKDEYHFLIGNVKGPVEEYEDYRLKIDDVVPMNESLIEYIIDLNRLL
ncbi:MULTISPECIES: hypothetical protein [Turicibacter]|jgi:hypothetical protein|uniref:hypothetical protein n=1 Tax=Turicibacter TaxID=191303 RepID=UPI0001FD9CE3|nr:MULTISPECIES: hypothetical protein [Turicibacter]EGC92787.1 hypothetical protein HMPREF9402_1397 [Turicibacter sp. HGF1]MBP3903734.1 hypothetical protein [Turicibacter sp.]MCU7190102.1 hypothetical protein [Turicibacter sanguinis]MCU7195997.1 hypothetical protein [Turicibacter sanguinis]MCU7210922.1 hypothetical protein [Turicibacter sanguinis]